MMSTIVNEKRMTFKELEQKVFDHACEYGRNIIKSILETHDVELMESRDKGALRNKGFRQTTVKTVMGSVGYDRRIYETKDDEGHKAWVYLLDQEMQMEKIGMISSNLAEKIADVVSENSYHSTAEIISSTSGQAISHGGAWNLVQKLGERISEEETARVSEMDAGCERGEREIKLLFEEMDGVWLKMQGEGHKKVPKREIKVAVMYEGWVEDGKDNSSLSNRRVLAGMEKSREFHDKREAQIRNVYNADEIVYRILNGDGGSWVEDPYDPERVFQLDPFHIESEIKKKLPEKKAASEAKELFHVGEYDGLLGFIDTYATSVATSDEEDKRSKKALELLSYLGNNREGLVPWQKQRDDYPEAPEGIVYKNMGVMENQNFTIITKRMKGGRRRWSENGANHMAKLLYTKENKELIETIGRYAHGLVYARPVEEILKTLSAAKAPKKDGKGSPYLDNTKHYMPILDAAQTEARKTFRKIFACA